MAPGTYLGRSCDYEYKDCVVPAKNMLGPEGMGFRFMMDQLNRNRTVIGAPQLLPAAKSWGDRVQPWKFVMSNVIVVIGAGSIGQAI